MSDDTTQHAFDPASEFLLDEMVEEKDVGKRLDKWLADKHSELSRSRLKALIDEGNLFRDGASFTNGAWKIRLGESYLLKSAPLAPAVPEGENIPLDVMFEDDDLIVVNKSAGMVVHPAAGNWDGTLVNALIYHCRNSLSGIGGVARPGIVHRIDKDTSGLLVVAKNDFSHQKLTADFAAHTIERKYKALIHGAPRPGVGVIDAPIGRSSSDRKKFTALSPDTEQPDARNAVTHFKILETFGRTRAKLKGDAVASLVECRLETGRTHQIRVHMNSLGYPLLGDPLYGRPPGLAGVKPGDGAADRVLGLLDDFRRQALHAATLGFAHPRTNEPLHFAADPSDDFNSLYNALKLL